MIQKFTMCFLLAASIGCSVEYRKVTIPKTEPELLVFIASEEAEIEGIEMELSEAKESREKIYKAAESAQGWYSQSEYSNKISHANSHVESIARRLTWAKTELSTAKQKLKSLENKESE